MTEQTYAATRIKQAEALCRQYFGVRLPIEQMLGDDIETGKDAYCMLFQTKRHQLFALYISPQPQTLANVRQTARAMGLEIESYALPFADETYFKRRGFEIFQKAYPGRKQWTSQEAAYYQTLVPYSPALIKVAKIHGEIRRYNPNYSSKWQKVIDMRYAKMKVVQG